MKKIFILHGWAYSTERWKPFIDELARNDTKTDMLKIPGLTAPLNEVWNIDKYVEWLEKILSKEKEPVILLGHSNGGLISIAYVLKYPENVRQLILIDSTAIYHNDIAIRLKRLLFMAAAKTGKTITKSLLMRKILYKVARAHD